MIQIYIDGSCEPVNPCGNCCYGMIVKQNGKTIYQESKFIGSGEGMSNNVAEWCGVQAAIHWLKQQNETKAEILSDSQMVVNQANGKWKVKKGMYKSYADTAIWKLKNFDLKFTWIPRELNEEADALSKPLTKA